MSKSTKTRSKPVQKRPETPLVVYTWSIGLALITYVVARIALDGYPHPLHWGSAVAGGLLGIVVGWAWFRWRGDIA